MRILTTTCTALFLSLAATAVRAESLFHGTTDYESPFPMLLHISARLIGRLFS
ncbi:hypothetical protein [Herbaspirillum huttiense]|uniref:Uncharacterized protein n=2 Tax=Herbaspirillum huttiense TaxID=863372 RepID=A0AAJ2HGS9_9BURK|nr:MULTISPECIES: hypothetical protein [Herbaspirillum]MDR9838365.1 hypothetical protein [Herbaspirillum huttiense]UWE15183.1 hypothetical protein NY669_19085 [Herbaspirillum huttiense]